MSYMISIGELAEYQNISRQTLIYYDKIGLFKPAWVDPDSGYRYYSPQQLDYLDTILIMKKIGIPLSEIKEHLQNLNTADSLKFMGRQLEVIEGRIRELSLIQNRLRHRCGQMEQALARADDEPELSIMPETCILYSEIERPYGQAEISIATKKCYAQAFAEKIPIFFQSGVSVPLERISAGRCAQAGIAFLTTDFIPGVDNIKRLPRGLAVSLCHRGNYYRLEAPYSRLIEFCRQQGLEIISDSYEFCINDYVTSSNENEYITKLMFYVREGRNSCHMSRI